MNFTWC